MRKRPARAAVAAVVAVLALTAAACEPAPTAEATLTRRIGTRVDRKQRQRRAAVHHAEGRQEEGRAGGRDLRDRFGWHHHQRDRDGLG